MVAAAPSLRSLFSLHLFLSLLLKMPKGLRKMEARLAQFKAALPSHLRSAFPALVTLMKTLTSHALAATDFASSTDPTLCNLREFHAQLTVSQRNLSTMKTLHKRAVVELVDNPLVPLEGRLTAATCLISYYNEMYFSSLSHIRYDFPRSSIFNNQHLVA